MKSLAVRVFCIGLLVGVIVSATQAATVTWNGADMTWNQPDNDSFSAQYNGGDVAQFAGSGQGAVTVSAGVTPDSMTLSSGSYDFSGGDLTISNGLMIGSSGNMTVSGTVITNLSTVWVGWTGSSSSGGSLSISNSAQWYGSTLYIGYGSSGTANNNSYNVADAPGVISNGAIRVGWATSSGGHASYNTMTVSNATMQMGGALTIGRAGNNVYGNQVIVDNQGTLQLGANSIGICNVSDYTWPNYNDNGLIIVNGGVVSGGSLTVDGGRQTGTYTTSRTNFVRVASGGTLITAAASFDNTSYVSILGGGSGGPTSTWDLAGNTLSLNGNTGGFGAWLNADGNGVEGGAVVTNVSTLYIGSDDVYGSATIHNGARVFAANVHVGDLTGKYNTLTVGGGSGFPSVLNAGGGYLYVGAYASGNEKPDYNRLAIDAGGIVTNVGAFRLGYHPSTTYGSAAYNTMVVTNGGKLFTTGTSHIGYNGNNGDGNLVKYNKATVAGAGSLWNLGGANLILGRCDGSTDYSRNNSLTVGTGGVVTNINAFSVGGSGSNDGTTNAVVLLPGGHISASSATILGDNSLEVVLDDAQSALAGELSVSGTLNVSAATLEISLAGKAREQAYIIGSYGTLTGPFAATNGLPERWEVKYGYGAGDQIALIPPPASGTVLLVL